MASTSAALAATALLAIATLGCGSEPTCGAGTHRSGDRCVADEAMVCGPGTSAVDGACVAPATATDVAQPAGDGAAGDDTVGGDTAAGDTAAGDAVADDAAAGDTAATDGAGADAAPGPCVPYCVGRVCGDDGCGGSCGSCTDPAKPSCDGATFACVALCVPACQGRACGDDGCGGSCGACAADAACTALGRCLPKGWTCDPARHGDGAVCDCGCGAADADCVDVNAIAKGCSQLQSCVAGVCKAKAPAAWTCAAASYAALDACNCGCGAPDPDCAYSNLPVWGCKGLEASCDDQGACKACTPKCAGKACGDDGCGGSCGPCNDPKASFCHLGACVDPCGAVKATCLSHVCGDDGCGGSCGICNGGATCKGGQCVVPAPVADPQSCVGRCGSAAPAGCICVASCSKNGTCCKDFQAACACTPDCVGKSCGSDGCGGSCGACPASTPTCTAAGLCTSACVPACGAKVCGDDGCGGSCGTCQGGTTCSALGACTPAAWTCGPLAYGDKMGCDCGCGAADSDCTVAGTSVLGCPTGVSTCSAAGVCAVAFCHATAACSGSAWCTGLYAKGDGRAAGSCALPVAKGAPPGATCGSHGECATEVCLAGRCRVHCATDASCGPGELCVALEAAPGAPGATPQVASVCAQVPGTRAPCASQATCGAGAEVCVALADGVSLAPRLVCSAAAEAKQAGASCADAPCALGQVCVASAKGDRCALPCPAGAADCGPDHSCTSVPLHRAGTVAAGDDPKVAVCVAK